MEASLFGCVMEMEVSHSNELCRWDGLFSMFSVLRVVDKISRLCRSHINIRNRSFVRSFVCLLVLFVVSHSLFYIPSAKVVIYKEPPKRGSGPCTSLKWSTGTTDPVLFAGFSTGRLSTYKLISGAVERVNSVSLGIAVSPTNERTNE